MLQKLRKSTASIIAKSLFALLILSFAAWGIQGYIFQAQQSDAVATIGETKITGPELSRAFRQDLRRFQLGGIDITPEQARDIGLLDQSLERLISGRLYSQAGDWLGLAVSDAMVSTAIQQEPAFFDETGRFSRDRFNTVLSQGNYSEGQFVADMRRDIYRRQILNSFDIAGDAPMAMVRPLNAWRGEKRVAVVAAVPIDDSLDVGKPDDETLRRLHEEMASEFTAPERRVVAFVDISPQVATREIAVAEEELRDEYERRIDEFREPRLRIVQQIRLPDEATGKRAAAALASGESFADVARDIAGQDANDLEFGRFADGEFPLPDVAQSIEGLDVGEVSDPVESAFGWHIFRLSGFQEEQTRSFEDVRADIERDLKSSRVGDMVQRLANDIEDVLARGDPLEEAARSAGLEVRRVGPLDISGVDADGNRVADLPDGEFLNAAFAADPGTAGRPIETDDGGYFILRVDGVVPSALQPLAEVRDAVTAAWSRERRRDAARERALEIVQSVESGAQLATVAEREGLSVTETEPLDRRGRGAQSDLVTPPLVSDIFRLQIGQAAMAEMPDGYVVAQLKRIVPADTDTIDQLATVVGDGMVSDIIIQFNNALRREFGVKVDRSVINRLF